MNPDPQDIPEKNLSPEPDTEPSDGPMATEPILSEEMSWLKGQDKDEAPSASTAPPESTTSTESKTVEASAAATGTRTEAASEYVMTGSKVPKTESKPKISPDKSKVPRLYRYLGIFLIDSSRLIVMGWCFWLLASGVMVWGGKAFPILQALREYLIRNEGSAWQDSFASSLVMSTALYGGGIHWMMLSSCIGWLLLWPSIRLSQQYAIFEVPIQKTKDEDEVLWRHPRRQSQLVRKRISSSLIFRDWLTMSLIFQAVVWPISFRAGWSTAQTLTLDFSVIGWSLLVAGIVNWGIQPTRVLQEDGQAKEIKPTGFISRRTFAMMLCVLLVLGDSLYQWFALIVLDANSETAASHLQAYAHLQPLKAFLRLSEMKFSGTWQTLLPEAISLWLAAGILWLFSLLSVPNKSRQSQTLAASPD